jgi:hypothetical protein
MKTIIFLSVMLLTISGFAQVKVERIFKTSLNQISTPYDMIKASDDGFFITGGGKNLNNEKSMFLLKVTEDLDSSWVKHYHRSSNIENRGDIFIYNSDGNLCVLGISFGPGVFVSLWELDQNGDTIRTAHTTIGSSGIEFVITDAVARPNGGFIALVRNTSTAGTVYSFDEDLNIQWSSTNQTVDWSAVSPNAQFTGVELVDTVLYFSARKINGADHHSYLVKSGLSGKLLDVDTFGVHDQQIRAEDIVISSNNEVLMVGTRNIEISTGLTSARLMILKTNLDGDSLDIITDKSHHFAANADLIDASIVVNCEGFPPSGPIGHLSTASVVYFNEQGVYQNHYDHMLFNSDTNTTPTHKAIRTIKSSDGDFVTMGVRGDNWTSRVYMVKYTPVLTGLAEFPKLHSIFIYPNPAQDQVTVSYPNEIEDLLIVIRDMQGRVLPSKLSQTHGLTLIDVSKFSSGFYQVTCAWENKMEHFALFVAH